jgi:hypothetical protein
MAAELEFLASFASLMIAAGVRAKHMQTYLGHSSVATTLDVYGHLMPGAEAGATELLDATWRPIASAPTRPLGRPAPTSPLPDRGAYWGAAILDRLSMRDNYSSLPILKIFVPQSGHVPWIAGRPFFIVTCWGSLISTFLRSLTQ